MNNHERYKRAFQALHAPEDSYLEAVNMNKQRERFCLSRRAAAVVLAAVLVVGSLTAAYAADLGGFRRMLTLWVHGKPTDAQVEFFDPAMGDADDAGTDRQGESAQPDYVVTWTDGNGEERQMMGGGVAIEPGGVERPLTMDEYLEHIEGMAVEQVEVTEDGRVMFYWYDQAVDITDRFENGVCRFTLTHGDETMYFTVIDAGDGAYNVSAAADGYAD